MAFPPSPGRRNPKSSGRSVPSSSRRSSDPLDADRKRIEEDLKALERKEAELRRLQEQKIREMEDLPRRIAEQQKKEREKMRERALTTVTDDVFRPRRDRRHVPLRADAARMTRPEQRAARFQFLILCAVLFAILLILWKSLP